MIQTTQTNANGDYTFSQLTPGDLQRPRIIDNGYYFEVAFAGTAGGTAADNHDIDAITLPMAVDAQQYNFYVAPPSSLTGRVMMNLTGELATKAGRCLACRT